MDGCPLYTNDDFGLAMQQEEDILGKYPNLDAFIPTGGFSEFLAQAYKTGMAKYKQKIASHTLVVPVADTLPMQLAVPPILHGPSRHLRGEYAEIEVGLPIGEKNVAPQVRPLSIADFLG